MDKKSESKKSHCFLHKGNFRKLGNSATNIFNPSLDDKRLRITRSWEIWHGCHVLVALIGTVIIKKNLFYVKKNLWQPKHINSLTDAGARIARTKTKANRSIISSRYCGIKVAKSPRRLWCKTVPIFLRFYYGRNKHGLDRNLFPLWPVIEAQHASKITICLWPVLEYSTGALDDSAIKWDN